jgi:hypothetical protein
MITALGFYACGLYFLYCRRHDEHKWHETTAIFIMPGTIAFCVDSVGGSMSRFAAITSLAVLGELAVANLCAHAERLVLEHRRGGRPISREAVSTAAAGLTVSFIVLGYAYIQVLAWVWPDKPETWLNFAGFWVAWATAVSLGLSWRQSRERFRDTPQTQAIRR